MEKFPAFSDFSHGKKWSCRHWRTILSSRKTRPHRKLWRLLNPADQGTVCKDTSIEAEKVFLKRIMIHEKRLLVQCWTLSCHAALTRNMQRLWKARKTYPVTKKDTLLRSQFICIHSFHSIRIHCIHSHLHIRIIHPENKDIFQYLWWKGLGAVVKNLWKTVVEPLETWTSCPRQLYAECCYFKLWPCTRNSSIASFFGKLLFQAEDLLGAKSSDSSTQNRQHGSS